MTGFNFNFDLGFNDVPKMIPVESLKDPLEPDPNLQVSVESDQRVVLSGEGDRPTGLVELNWGGRSDVSMGPGSQGGGSPTGFVVVAGPDGTNELYIYIYGDDPRFHELFPVLTQIKDATIHLYLMSGNAVLKYASFLQIALGTTESHIITYFNSPSGSSYDSLGFFVAAFSTEIAPLPYDLAFIKEPVTLMTCCIGGVSSEVKYKAEVHSNIVSGWYKVAEARGLLTTEEIVLLNQGEVVEILDVNRRIKLANTTSVKEAMLTAGLL